MKLTASILAFDIGSLKIWGFCACARVLRFPSTENSPVLTEDSQFYLLEKTKGVFCKSEKAHF